MGWTDNHFASLKLPLESRCCQVLPVFAEWLQTHNEVKICASW